jgi:hypothetical protein
MLRRGEASEAGTKQPGSAGVAAEHTTWRGWLRWLTAIGWAVILLVVAARSASRVDVPALLAYAIGFTVVATSVLASAWRCPPAKPAALVCALLAAAALFLFGSHPLAELDMAVAVTACLLVAGTLVGAVVGRALEHPGHLVFVAIVSSAADAFSVFHPSGPSAAIVKSEAALSLLALPWPMLGTHAIEPFLGVGDVVFAALYVAAARRHALPLRATLLALTLGFAVTMVAVVALEAAVPALPFLGLAMVIAHRQARRPPERDRIRGYAMAAAVVAGVAVLLLW